MDYARASFGRKYFWAKGFMESFLSAWDVWSRQHCLAICSTFVPLLLGLTGVSVLALWFPVQRRYLAVTAGLAGGCGGGVVPACFVLVACGGGAAGDVYPGGAQPFVWVGQWRGGLAGAYPRDLGNVLAQLFQGGIPLGTDVTGCGLEGKSAFKAGKGFGVALVVGEG